MTAPVMTVVLCLLFQNDDSASDDSGIVFIIPE